MQWAVCTTCSATEKSGSTYALRHADSVYACLVFLCVGLAALVAVYMQSHDAFRGQPVAVTGAFITVGMACWMFTFSLFVLVFSVVRRLWSGRSIGADACEPVYYDEEMVRLMDAIDSKKHDRPVRRQVHGHGGGASDDALSRGAHVLKIRMDLAVNIYFVAAGVFSSIFALCMLHQRAVESFAASLLVLALYDFARRCSFAPVCHDAAADVRRVHRTLQGLEGGVIFLVAVLLLVIAAKTTNAGDRATDTTAETAGQTLVLAVGGALAPWLLWCAPSRCHNLVTLESATPVSLLVAVATLFILSPVESYVKHVSTISHSWLLFLGVPLLAPVTIIGVLHLLQQRLAVLPAFSLVFWVSIHALAQRTVPDGLALVPAMALCAVCALAAWRAYGRRMVQDHAVAVTAPYAVATGACDPHAMDSDASANSMAEDSSVAEPDSRA